MLDSRGLLMKSGNLNDKILKIKLSRKDKDAFVRTYDMYFDQIYRFVFFKVSVREEAEDITSQVFLKAWSYVQDNSVKDYKTLKSLLYKIARNLIIDHYRKKSTQNEQVSLESNENKIDVMDEAQDLAKDMEVADAYSDISKLLFELKDEYREIIVMRYVNELSVGEIALSLGKSRGNVRVTLYRALKALRQIAGEQKT